LRLFIIGTIIIRFICTKASGAPSDIPDIFYGFVAASEGAVCLKGIAGISAIEIINYQGRVTGLDIHLQIAPGAEPKGAEETIVEAVGKNDIGVTLDFAAFDLVSVAFFVFGIVKGFAVSEPDLRVLSAADKQFGIGGGQEGLVEEDCHVGVGGDGQGLGTL